MERVDESEAEASLESGGYSDARRRVSDSERRAAELQ